MAATILVVDDDLSLLESLKDLLEFHGYVVLTAPSGNEALRLLENLPTPPDLIISDSLMPGISGLIFMKGVRAKWPSLPFIMLSAKKDPIGLEGGSYDVLTKPLDPQELLILAQIRLRFVPERDRAASEDKPKTVEESDGTPPPARPKPIERETEEEFEDLDDDEWQTLPDLEPSPEPADEITLDDVLTIEEENKQWQQSEPPPQPIPLEKPITETPAEQAGTGAPIAPPPPRPVYPPQTTSSQGSGRQQEASAPAPSAQAHFSAYYPAAIKSSQPYTLMVFAHLESLRTQVAERAARYKDMMGGKQSSGTTPSRVEIASGSLLTFVPQIAGITFDPPEYHVVWQPPYLHSASFLFSTPADLNTDLSGQISVFLGPLIIGEIPVTMTYVPETASTTLDKSSEFKKFDPIFASYSHRDTPVMEFFRRARQQTGQKMLVDIYDLRSGEHWAQRLLGMIDESAVFQLFWSRHSAQSNYCRQEWEYACRYLDSRPRFIQPVWWEAPMPPPPPPLQDLHFQRIELPPLTQMQLVMGRLRKLFNRNP